MTEAVVTIKGRNELGSAIRQAEHQLRGLLKTGELFKKALSGGAILGAAYAFERLAQNAEQAALKIGDQGTAKALKQLNRAIDDLKSKGLNVIGRVLGESYIAVAGTEIQKLEVRVRNLREQLDMIRRGGGGRAGFELGAAPVAQELAAAEERLALLRRNDPNGASAPLGSAARTRALSRGGGSEQLVRSLPPTAGRAADPFSGLSEINVWQRQIFSLRNEQAKALEELSEMSRRDVAADLQQVANETTKMLGTMSEEWKAATEGWSVMADQAARNIQSSFAQFLFDPFEEGLRGMAAGFVDTIRQMVAELVAQQILLAFFNWGASAFSGAAGSFFSSMAGSIGKRAAGGPVMGGGAYLVGERGPEVFVPRSSGQIVANGALGGVTLNYSIDARGADAERIMAVLPGLLRRTKDETVAAVMDLSRRGRLA